MKNRSKRTIETPSEKIKTIYMSFSCVRFFALGVFTQPLDWLDLPSSGFMCAVLVELFICQREVVEDELLNGVSEPFGAPDIW